MGRPISSNAHEFPYQNATCGVICSTNLGPFSPIRGGSGDNIYVIPAPDGFSFGEATLLAAACCIPAILLLVSMWLKILKNNWKTRFGRRSEVDGEPSDQDEPESQEEPGNQDEPLGKDEARGGKTPVIGVDSRSLDHAKSVSPKWREFWTGMLRRFREFYKVLLFSAAVLAVLIIGERNLFSVQVRYQTEPVTNVGK